MNKYCDARLIFTDMKSYCRRSSYKEWKKVRNRVLEIEFTVLEIKDKERTYVFKDGTAYRISRL